MWYAAYLVKCAGRPVMSMPAPGGRRSGPTPAESAKFRENAALFDSRNKPAPRAPVNPALRNTLLAAAVGAGSLGLGYGMHRLMTAGSGAMLPGSDAAIDANDPAARIKRDMEEKQRLVNTTAVGQ